MDITELKDFLSSLSPFYIARIERYHPEIYKIVMKNTPFVHHNSMMKERVYCILNDIKSIPLCEVCNKNTLTFHRKKNSYSSFCSTKCIANSPKVKEKTKLTNLERYGVENPFQSEEIKNKIKETNLERYGTEHAMKCSDIVDKVKLTNLERYSVEHPSQSEEVKERARKTNFDRYGVVAPTQLKEIRDKVKATNIERYGVEYPLQREDVKEKIKKTNLIRYGTEYASQSEEVKEKFKKTCLERYGVENPSFLAEVITKRKKTSMINYGVDHFAKNNQSPEVRKKIEDKLWLEKEHYEKEKSQVQIAKELDVHQSLISNYFNIHSIEVRYNGFSMAEKEILEFVKDNYYGTIVNNDREQIKPLELDIYLPELSLAIEYCGLYWHSHLHKDRNYHLNKLQKCNEQNIRLITIFEDEWSHKQELVKSKLLNTLNQSPSERLYARKCSVGIPTICERKTLLNEHHIQGDGVGSINLGLYHEDKLVSVMTFKDMKNGIYDLNRFASSMNVIGGFSKLLSHFKKNYEFTEIYTFADKRWSEGNIYLKNGFTHIYDSKPNHFYFKNDFRESRQKFMKHKLKDVLEMFDPNLSETQNMDNNGYLRIYDCGNMKFSLQI